MENTYKDKKFLSLGPLNHRDAEDITQRSQKLEAKMIFGFDEGEGSSPLDRSENISWVTNRLD